MSTHRDTPTTSMPPSVGRSSRRSITHRARRIHRYLGIVIGVQFLLWTLGGLYFSWTRLDAVHGDHLVRQPALLDAGVELASPAIALATLRGREAVDSLVAVELVTVLGRPVYRLQYLARTDGRPTRRTQLADAETGALRPPLAQGEAVAVARAAFAGPAAVASVEYLTAENVGRHHEYREQPLPAWAVSFEGPERATAYVPADVGRVLRIRNDRWRAFDFLWMLHTMDYRGRDDINNTVLRAFSVLGLATVFSGFALFALTTPSVRRRLSARSAPR